MTTVMQIEKKLCAIKQRGNPSERLIFEVQKGTNGALIPINHIYFPSNFLGKKYNLILDEVKP